jgi:hypothetical protein
VRGFAVVPCAVSPGGRPLPGRREYSGATPPRETEQIEVERGRADQEFGDLRHHDGRYEGGWLIGASETEKWKWLNISTVVSVEIHRESDLDPDQAA